MAGESGFAAVLLRAVARAPARPPCEGRCTRHHRFTWVGTHFKKFL